MYTYDPRFFAHSSYGMAKTGPFRAAFLQECVGELKEQLRGVGSDLLVAVGRPEEVIAGGCCRVAAGVVFRGKGGSKWRVRLS